MTLNAVATPVEALAPRYVSPRDPRRHGDAARPVADGWYRTAGSCGCGRTHRSPP